LGDDDSNEQIHQEKVSHNDDKDEKDGSVRIFNLVVGFVVCEINAS
jgi:hypothetical protein